MRVDSSWEAKTAASTTTAGAIRRRARDNQKAMPTNTMPSAPTADASFISVCTSGKSRPENQATTRWSSSCIGADSSEVSRLGAVTTTKATLKPYLSELRDWVSQGMTDVWIAHRLNSTPASISAFRSQHGILRRDVLAEVYAADVPPPVIPPEADEPEPEVKPRRRSRGGRKKSGETAAAAAAAEPAEGNGEGGAKRRRRRRGGRGRGKRLPTFEAVLDTGDE